MPSSATATALTTHASHPFGLFVGGEDIIAPVGSANKGVAIQSIRVQEAGAGSAGILTCTFDDPAKAYTLQESAEVIFWDFALNIPIFAGYLIARAPTPAFGQQGRSVNLTFTDYSPLLDQQVVPFASFTAGLSDQTILQSIFGYYGGPISALGGTVASTNASMPAVILQDVTLRQAVEQIGAAAGGSRIYWIDSLRRINYTTSSSATAPYIVKDNPTLGTETAVENLTLDQDEQVISAVYVRGANVAGSGWVRDTNSQRDHPQFVRQAFIDQPDSDTATKRASYGAAYLADTKSAVVRGSFEVSKADGWRPGQIVTITNAALGLAAVQYQIVSVDTDVRGGTGYRHYKVGFGALPRSFAKLVGKGGPPTTIGGSVVGTITTAAGDPLLGTVTDASNGGFGGAVRRYITSSVYNGDFTIAPPAADSPIGLDNPLPYWSFNRASGTAVSLISTADSSAASGRVIRMLMASGVAGDDSNIEQIVPVNGSRAQSFMYVAEASFYATGSSNSVQAYIICQYLTQAGVNTGAAINTSTTFAGAGVKEIECPVNSAILPSDAYYLRIRVGMYRGAALDTATATIDLTEVRLAIGQSPIYIADLTNQTYSASRLMQSGGIVSLQANYLQSGGGLKPLLQLDGTAAGDATLVAGGAGTTAGVSAHGAGSAAPGQLDLVAVGAGVVAVKGPPCNVPSAQQTLIATDAILVTRGVAYITSGGNITLTSAPTIANGTDGQYVTIVNHSSFTITLQDQGTLANSNLRLSTATYVLSQRDNITLMYDSTVADWVEVNRTNVI